jgi:hypothetical protein
MTWKPDAFPIDRTLDTAFRQARRAFDEIAKDSKSFESVAMQFSDDVVTRSRGGSLGGIRAGQLPREYLDALATLRPGEVSGIFRTALGFHIVKRRSPPAEFLVSGKRIVIRYQGTVAGRSDAGSERTRDTALHLAERVVERARAKGANFDNLIVDYSESTDAIQLGDIGLRSVRAPGFLPREIERLSVMRVGEVSEPMDSHFGFEILVRTKAEPRSSYAMTSVAVEFDPFRDPSHKNSKTSASRLAYALASELQRDPGRFEVLQDAYCCKNVEQWSEGQGPPEIEGVLKDLKFGDVAPEPIESGWFFYIPKRIDPRLIGTPPLPTYELPSPEGPDFLSIVENSEGRALARYARLLATDARINLQLDDSVARELGAQMEQLATSFEKSTDGATRVRNFAQTLERLRQVLDPAMFTKFQSFMNSWGGRFILGDGMPWQAERK